MYNVRTSCRVTIRWFDKNKFMMKYTSAHLYGVVFTYLVTSEIVNLNDFVIINLIVCKGGANGREQPPQQGFS